jgi:hypothetical protein
VAKPFEKQGVPQKRNLGNKVALAVGGTALGVSALAGEIGWAVSK